jgi:acetyl esterase/lipase
MGPVDDPLKWHILPLHALDFSGLPLAIIIIAAHEPLYNECIAYAHKSKRWVFG